MNEQRVIVDLDTNEVRLVSRVPPKVAEMIHILAEAGGSLETPVLIRRIWGLMEPADAVDSLSTLARKAREFGIPVWGKKGNGGSFCLVQKLKGLGPSNPKFCRNGHELTSDNIYRGQCRQCRQEAMLRFNEKRQRKSAARGREEGRFWQ